MHNNYLTLPVVFAMLSDHFPFTYGHAHAWLILVVLMAIGAWMRHFFNLRHQGRNAWWIPASRPPRRSSRSRSLIRPRRSGCRAPAARPPFAQVQAIVHQRCAPCHSLHPTQPGFSAPPRDRLRHAPREIERRAPR